MVKSGRGHRSEPGFCSSKTAPCKRPVKESVPLDPLSPPPQQGSTGAALEGPCKSVDRSPAPARRNGASCLAFSLGRSSVGRWLPQPTASFRPLSSSQALISIVDHITPAHHAVSRRLLRLALGPLSPLVFPSPSPAHLRHNLPSQKRDRKPPGPGLFVVSRTSLPARDSSIYRGRELSTTPSSACASCAPRSPCSPC
ncbi:hypothetical protein BKA56DRAFT_158327 [Ilyonectria sp. MPI-CAGE-AT-0026]|nr:hypothetical protein BKA56DRAFT_158327 [Ilyonectria sp. MPI-CAGE-AT-0026]